MENAFGILAARWRVLLNRLNLLPRNAEFVVLACCVLHNFMCATPEAYVPAGYVDSDDEFGNTVPGQWRVEAEKSELFELERTKCKNFAKKASDARNIFADYFMQEGSVPWQWAHAGVQTSTHLQVARRTV